MKFFYNIGVDQRQIEFPLLFGTTDEPMIPLAVICNDIGIDLVTQRRAYPVEPHKVNGKGQAVAHCTLATLVRMFDDLTQPKAFTQLQTISRSIVKCYYTDFANFINAQIKPVQAPDITDLWDDIGTTGVNVLRRDLVLDGCSPSEIHSIIVTGAREVMDIQIKPAYIEGFHKKPDPNEVFVPRIQVQRQQIGLVSDFNHVPDFSDYMSGNLRKSSSRSLREFEKTNPNHPAAARQLDHLNVHEVSPDGKSLVYIGPQPMAKPWDNEPVYVKH